MDTYYGIIDGEGYWYSVHENWVKDTLHGTVHKLKKTCDRSIGNAPMLFERYETARRWARTIGAHVVKMRVYGKRHAVWLRLGPPSAVIDQWSASMTHDES